MPATHTHIPVVHDHLAQPLTLGDPDSHGPLTVFPVFGPTPRIDYVSFAQGRAMGASIKELAGGASVNDLLVLNATDRSLLLYEGEEVLGAQQNRTFDVSVLVAAGARLQVPVSCVEAGRWDGSRHDEEFAAAPQAAYPALRRLKNRAARESVAAGSAPRAVQAQVWDEVSHKSSRMAVDSGTAAMHDIYDRRRDRLAGFSDAIELHAGQIGALVLIAGRPVVLDHVSRPEVLAALHGPLVQGYALDALEAPTAAAAPSTADAERFLERVLQARVSERDGIGLGRDLRFAEAGIAGAGLVAGDELVQLTAFPDDASADHDHRPAATRIRRPSRRRTA